MRKHNQELMTALENTLSAYDSISSGVVPVETIFKIKAARELLKKIKGEAEPVYIALPWTEIWADYDGDIQVESGGKTCALTKDDIDFLLKAVNNYYPLVNACKSYLLRLEAKESTLSLGELRSIIAAVEDEE